MKTLVLLISLILSAIVSIGQSVVNRTTGTNTVNDPRQSHTLNLVIPRYADTTQANLTSPNNIGVDSCGAIIFTYADGGRVYVRKCYPVKHWSAVADGANTPEHYDFIVSSSSFISTGQSFKFLPSTWIGWDILFIRGTVPQSETVPIAGNYFTWDASTAKLTFIGVTPVDPSAQDGEVFQIYAIGGSGSSPAPPSTAIVSPIRITGADFANATQWDGQNSASITISSSYTIQVFWNSIPIMLNQGVDWQRTATGMQINIPGFSATTTHLNSVFYIYISQ